MLNSILAICRAVFLILGGHKQVALENIALRQQLGMFQRSVRRPKIRPLDRLFWCVCGKSGKSGSRRWSYATQHEADHAETEHRAAEHYNRDQAASLIIDRIGMSTANSTTSSRKAPPIIRQ
jgi:hypothetical protein